MGVNFGDHYYDWRLKRVKAVIEHYGASWFRDRRILELACGYGDIGVFLVALGADVHFLEGRKEHIDVIKYRYPSIDTSKLILHNLEEPLPKIGLFDLIIHFGVLYHLDNWTNSIASACAISNNVVLETEVADSNDPHFQIAKQEDGPDQAISGIGTRPSGLKIENELLRNGFSANRITDSRCNSSVHKYDWDIENTGTVKMGYRRMWFCRKIDCQNDS